MGQGMGIPILLERPQALCNSLASSHTWDIFSPTGTSAEGPGAQRARLHPGSAQPGSLHAPAQMAKQRSLLKELENTINKDLETKLA